MSNALDQKAYQAGYEHGKSVGSWIIDGNTSDETKRAIIKGYDDGDPEVMDMQPSPLSGEWADDPTTADVLADLGINPDDDSADDLLNEYENGFSEGFWHEVIRSAQATLTDEDADA
jgi:hypothetical protein